MQEFSIQIIRERETGGKISLKVAQLLLRCFKHVIYSKSHDNKIYWLVIVSLHISSGIVPL